MQSESGHDHRLRRRRKTRFSPLASDSIHEISQCLEDKAQYRELLKLRGTRAQEVLDRLQTILDNATSGSLIWRQVLVAIQRLSQRTGLFPALYGLRSVRLLNRDAVSGGGYGEVYQGECNGDIVCLKKIRVYQTSDRQKIMKFYAKEAVLWAQLSDRNIVPFYGICEMGSSPCLVSAWATNGNVMQYLERNPNTDRLALITDMTLGLEYLHKRYIIHGDLKGANILVDRMGRACLADFGLSSIYDSKILDWSTQSAIASVGGTIRWQAPELLSELGPWKNTKSTDIYAFGCTCYEIMTGEELYAGVPHFTVLVKKMQGVLPAVLPQPTPEAWVKMGFTDNLWNLLLHCWTQKPDGRPSIEAVQTRLKEWGRRYEEKEVGAIMTISYSPVDSPIKPEPKPTLLPPPALTIDTDTTSIKAGITEPTLPIPPIQRKPQDVSPSSSWDTVPSLRHRTARREPTMLEKAGCTVGGFVVGALITIGLLGPQAAPGVPIPAQHYVISAPSGAPPLPLFPPVFCSSIVSF